jgi:hypothetical protein
MATTKDGQCILCQSSTTLCESHIVPEFCHKPIYDEKHRAYTFSPVTPEKTRFMQKGIRSRLLCAGCERDINDNYEKPFREFWVDGDVLAPLATAALLILKNVPYTSFKLFHLSVLLRASASDHPNFKEVELGAAASEIRQMVREGDPGPESRYQIVCSAVGRPDGGIWHDLIGPAHRVTVGGARAFYFTFCGAQWFYYVEGTTPEVDKLCLKQSGVLPIVKKPWKVIEHYRDMLAQ